MNLKNSILQDILVRFAAEGIEIPYPTRTLKFADAEQGPRLPGAAAKPKRVRRVSRSGR